MITMDKRWSRSQFAGLPRQFVSFAKRLDLQYKAGKKFLADRDGEPVAWLMDDPEIRASQIAGLDPLEIVLWHPDGEAKVSYSQLALIRNRADLLLFQGKTLEKAGDLASFSIKDVLEDSKKRAVRRAARSKMTTIEAFQAGGELCGDEIDVESPPPLDEALEMLGTIRPGDMLKDVRGQKVFVDVFENVGPIKPEEIDPRAHRPRGKN